MSPRKTRSYDCVSPVEAGSREPSTLSGTLGHRFARVSKQFGVFLTVATLSLAVVACKGTPPEVNVDTPELASSIRYLGSSAVVCAVLAVIALVWAAERRNRR